MNKGTKYGLLLIALMVLATTGAIQMGVIPLGVLPGFEGLDAGIEGVYIRGNFYELGDPLPDTWNYKYIWKDATPRSMILKAREGQISDWGGVRVEIDRPQIINDPFSSPKKIDYWVKDGAKYLHIKGEIIAYSIPITFSIRREGGYLQYIFHGEKVWFSLVSVAWNKAVQEQSPYTGEEGYGSAWEAPLAVVITSYSVNDQGDHYQLDPSISGRDIVLYDTRSQSGVISDLDCRSDINDTLAGDIRPDTRLSRTAFFPITMTDFGLTSGAWWSNAPVANYKLKVYTIQIGEYTYTNPDDTPWGTREPEQKIWETFIGNIASFLGSPFGFMSILFLGAIVIFIAVGGLPFLVGYMASRGRG